MDHHVDIDLHPDPEFSASHLMAALYAKLHRTLVNLKSDQIGVSFPGHMEGPQSRLGHRLRLHGTKAALNDLMSVQWLQGLRDHTTVSTVNAVPSDAQHCTVRRVQVQSNPDRLRRRLMRRHTLTAEEARLRIPDHVGERLDLPFVPLTSASTGQPFRLFLRHGEPKMQPTSGDFNTYGLSSTATLPWF